VNVADGVNALAVAQRAMIDAVNFMMKIDVWD